MNARVNEEFSRFSLSSSANAFWFLWNDIEKGGLHLISCQSHLISLSCFFFFYSLHLLPRACSPYLFIPKPVIFIFFLPLVTLMSFLDPILISFYFCSPSYFLQHCSIHLMAPISLWLSLSFFLSVSICVPAAEHIVYSFSIGICKRNVCAHQSPCLSPL